MSQSNKNNTSRTMQTIGAIMIVLAWIFGWIPQLGLFLFIGGGIIILTSIFFQ